MKIPQAVLTISGNRALRTAGMDSLEGPFPSHEKWSKDTLHSQVYIYNKTMWGNPYFF